MLMDGISESIDHSKALAGAVRELESNGLKGMSSMIAALPTL